MSQLPSASGKKAPQSRVAPSAIAWSVVMIALALGLAALFWGLSNDTGGIEVVPIWLQVSRPFTSALIMIFGPAGTKLTLRAFAGLFVAAAGAFVFALVAEAAHHRRVRRGQTS